jgi:hypothetical protein
MPVYRIAVEKRMGTGASTGRQWSNVYHVSEADIVAADGMADSIAALEKTLYPDNVAIVRLSTHGAPHTPGISRNVFIAGTRGSGTPATQLPLFNAVLAQFLPAEGRPSPKYLRLPLDESEVADSTVDPTLISTIAGSYASPLVALTGVTDESGQPFAGYHIKTAVQMRQLSWHRRKRVGFHRGWVPNP